MRLPRRTTRRRWRTLTAFFGTGALATTLLVGVTAVTTPAGAVSTEAELRAAFGNPDQLQITLTDSILLTDCSSGALERDSPNRLDIMGQGNEIGQTCDGVGVMHLSGGGPLFLDSVDLGGGDADDGGAVNTDGAVTLTNSVVSLNGARNSGGGISSGDNVTLRDSTVRGNNAQSDGGGIIADGVVTVVNSTISGNAAPNGRGGGIAAVGFVTFVYATVASNVAPTGANLHLTGGSLTPFGSVIAQPQGSDNCAFEGGASTSSNGWNLSDDNSCLLGANTDRQGFAADLAPLSQQPGQTPVRIPRLGSPLLDWINPPFCQDDGAAGITTDQRGVTRPQGSGCDIGSVEVEVDAPGSEPPPSTSDPALPPSSPTLVSPAAPAAPVPVLEVRFTG